MRADKQYFSTGMGREFATSDPSFRRDMERMDEVLRRLKNPPEWNIMGKKHMVQSNCHSRHFLNRSLT